MRGRWLVPVVCLAVGAARGPAAAGDATDDAAAHWRTTWHGYAFLTSNKQGGESGSRDFESANHVMLTTSRDWAGGRFDFLGTFTIEPATIPPQGAPELFQRGETYDGVLLVDRQHPHDLFVQLAAAWDKPLRPRTTLHLYAAPWGEPAVGPTAYPHRLSASANPAAPLAHHNQDSTHISASVITAGLSAAWLTIEGSAFYGQEPDENRWDIDLGPIDSYAGRLTVRPAPGLSLQISAARRTDPEALEEGNQTRQTISAEYRRTTANGFLGAALIVGRNLLEEGPEWGNGLEATWKFRRRHSVYGRVESVDRDVYELINKEQRPAGTPAQRTSVAAATLGYVMDVPLLHGVDCGLGADLTAYRFADDLGPVYGSDPLSLHVFMLLRFGSAGHAAHVH